MFTAITTPERAKWVPAYTADVLADATDERVCLLDADLAFPTVHFAYSVSNENGLTGALRGTCAIQKATTRISENLWIIPAGNAHGDPPMTSAIAQELIAELLQRFDYLIISAPGCDQLVQLSALATSTDGAVLVLDASTTRRAAAQEAKAALDIAKVHLLGSVLIDHTYAIPEVFSAHL